MSQQVAERSSEVPELDSEVRGVTCAALAERVQRVLSKQVRVAGAGVNVATRRARIVVDSAVDLEDLVAAVGKAGYGPAPVAVAHQEQPDAEAIAKQRWFRPALVAWPVGTGVMALSSTVMGRRWADFLALAPATSVQFWGGWLFLPAAAARARPGGANMHTLIAVGLLAAYGYSVVVVSVGGRDEHYFGTWALIIAFLSFRRYYEPRAKEGPSPASRALLEMGAQDARLIGDGHERMVPIQHVAVGDLVRMHEPESPVDESMLSGESVPVDTRHGDNVAGAARNANSVLSLRATAVDADTTLTQIVRLVENVGRRVRRGVGNQSLPPRVPDDPAEPGIRLRRRRNPTGRAGCVRTIVPSVAMAFSSVSVVADGLRPYHSGSRR